MKKYILIIIALLFFQFSNAQVKENKIVVKKSIADSIKLNHYLDEVNKYSLFHVKRQLYLDSVLTLEPKWAQIWQQKAMPLFKMRKYELGMTYLDSAVKYDNKDHSYLEYRAFIKCIFQKDYKASLADFDSIQKIKSTGYVMDHPFNFYRGLCFLQLNKFDSAEVAFTKCMEEEEKIYKVSINHLHWFYLGIIYYEKENYSKAIEYFNKSQEIYSHFSDAKYYKSLCLQNLGKIDEAYKIATEAKNDLEKGYTINEGNTPYEFYPYQIYTYFFKGYLENLNTKK